MKVSLLDDWKALLGEISAGQHKSPPEPFINNDRTYYVYEICFSSSSFYYPNIISIRIIDDFDNLILVPLIIFRIVDGCMPPVWRFIMNDHGFLIGPDLFREKYFFDDVSEREPKAVADLLELRRKVEGA